MNKYYIFLSLAVGAMIFTLWFIISQINKCECVQYETFELITVKSDLSSEVTTDSICTVEGDASGTLFIKKFKP